MKKKITSVPGLFGEIIHYDENGERIGESRPGLLDGSMIHYDADGNPVGRSDPGLFSDLVHRDGDGSVTGESIRGVFGTLEHYGPEGHGGTSVEMPWGTDTEFDP